MTCRLLASVAVDEPSQTLLSGITYTTSLCLVLNHSVHYNTVEHFHYLVGFSAYLFLDCKLDPVFDLYSPAIFSSSSYRFLFLPSRYFLSFPHPPSFSSLYMFKQIFMRTRMGLEARKGFLFQ